MARETRKLTDVKVTKHQKKGMLSDGAGLYLHTGPTGGKSWVYRYKRTGTQTPTDMGLGAYPGVTLKMARDAAMECARQRSAGIDPLDHRRQANQQERQAEQPAFISVTGLRRARDKSQRAVGDMLEQLVPGVDKLPADSFAEIAASHIASKQSTWSATSLSQWLQSLRDHAKPVLMMRTAAIETAHVRQCLDPIWSTKTETARRLRGRIETVLDIARANELRTGENPARWGGLLSVSYTERAKIAPVDPFSAMPYSELPGFYRALSDRRAMAATALQFLILTGCRTGEVTGARWSEIDNGARLWVIPGSRMKRGKEHRVPLSAPALEILDRLRADCVVAPTTDKDGNVIKLRDYVFNSVPGKPLSGGAMRKLLARMKRSDITPHGFRSCLRDWAADCTTHDFVTCEQALSRVIGGSMQQADLRDNALDKRRELMRDWAAWATTGNVVSINTHSQAKTA